mgnify:CR=1 FL=1
MNSTIDSIDAAITVLAVAAALAAVVCVLRNRLPGWPTVIGLVLLETALLVGVVANVIALIGTDRHVDAISLLAYLIALLIIVPVGVLWAFVDRTRYGVAAIVLVCLAVPVMVLRTQQIWEHAGVS